MSYYMEDLKKAAEKMQVVGERVRRERVRRESRRSCLERKFLFDEILRE